MEAGFDLRCASRDPDSAERDAPEGMAEVAWTRVDVEEPATLGPALEGCDAVLHLVHQMDGEAAYPEREKASAEALRDAAEEAGLKRIVFLGGPDPGPEGSKHLRSRLASGAALRAGSVTAVELRAAMIIGHGSASWTMTRDLAKRLPAMILPRWAENHSWPIGIEDVVVALAAGLVMPLQASQAFDIPGSERVTHHQMLERAASAMGKDPPMVKVPVLSPRLSSYWIALITGVDLHMAQELVEGVKIDLDPTVDVLWERIDHRPAPIEEAIRRALAEEKGAPPDRARVVKEIAALFQNFPNVAS